MTFVLVHGAWTGAHGFHLVRPRLRALGHEVVTPSLTGLGERSHLLTPDVGLPTHVQDVVNAVVYEDLTDVVLLGFSYGGAVVTGAVDELAPRIRELVYLDAFVPADGQSVAELTGRVADPGDDWVIPAPPRDFEDPVEGAWQQARRGPHPARCFSEPVRISQPLESYPCGLTYIKASAEGRDAPGGAAFWAAADHARESSRWRYHEIATTHMVASNRPDELVAILAALGS